MKVRDAMHKGVAWVSADASVPEIAARMRDLDIGAIPIGENDRLIGMVTDRDIAIRAFNDNRDPRRLKARDVMSEGIVCCEDSAELDEAVRIMEDKQIRRLPVLDGEKKMVGLLSLGDVAHASSHEVSGSILEAVAEHHSG